MKTIKIFIASSNELEPERKEMAALANSMNTVLEKQGVQVIAVEWENVDASMGVNHKQEDYNERLRDCDMCMVLYWTKFGKYTKTELDTAFEEFKAGHNPHKIYVYFKENTDSSNLPTEELQEFRDSFPTKYGHFYTPFSNFDTLKAHFLLQFMEYQSQTLERSNAIEVKNGKVIVDGKEYVDLKNVPFAGNNEKYNELKEEIQELKDDLAEMSPESPRYTKKSARLLEKQEKLSKMESSLWDTALMITKLSTTKCSERLQHAMDLFSAGDNKGAQAILNEEEINKDIQHNLNLIKLGEEGEAGLKINIEELRLELRLLRSSMIYEKGSNKRSELLRRIEKILSEVIECTSILYGKYSEEVVKSYDATKFYLHSNPLKVLEYLKKQLDVKCVLFNKYPDKIISAYTYISDYCHQHKLYSHEKEYLLIASKLTKEYYGELSKEYVQILLTTICCLEELRVSVTEEFDEAINIAHKISYPDCIFAIYEVKLKHLLRNHNSEYYKRTFTDFKNESICLGRQDLLLKMYMVLGCELKFTSPKSAINHYNFALELAEKLMDKANVFNIYENLVNLSYRLSKYQDTIAFYNKIQDSDCDKALTKIISRSYAHLGDFSNAKHYAEIYLMQCKRSKVDVYTYEHNKIDSYENLIRIFIHFNNFDKALTYIDQIIRTASTSYKHVRINIRKLYFLKAHVFIYLSKLENAIECYNKVLNDDALTLDSEDKIEVLLNMSDLYLHDNNITMAKELCIEAINIGKQFKMSIIGIDDNSIRNFKMTQAVVYVHLSLLYVEAEDYSNAQEYLIKSYDECSENRYNYRFNDLLKRRYIQGIIFRGQKRYQEAIDIFRVEARRIGKSCSYTEIAKSYLAWDRPDEAFKTIIEIYDASQKEYMVHITLGAIYHRLREYSKAAYELTTGLQLMKEHHCYQKDIIKVQDEIENIHKELQS